MKACDHSVRKGLPAILLMAGLLAACGNEAADDVTDPMSGEETPTVLPAGEAIAGAKVATLDPATMVDAEIQTVLGGPPRCVFRYTSFGKPVLALGGGADGAPAAAVVKLNGHLIQLPAMASDARIDMAADPVRLTLSPSLEAGEEEATLLFEIGQDMRVGYRGYSDCD